MSGFNNPVVGALNLIRRAIRSPDFETGVQGWSINQDGSAEFNDVTLTGGSLVVTETGQGVFVYAGTPTLGNLIVSIASAAGTDDFGNAYPEGIDVTEGNISGSVISVEPGPDNGVFVYSTAPASTTFDSGSGTWTAPAGVTSVLVECWGAGGGGQGGVPIPSGGPGSTGGGGGEYAAEIVTVVPGNAYPYAVGSGGAAGATNGGDGGNSTFDTTAVVAHGGHSGGTGGGGGTGSTNTTHHDGGDGFPGLLDGVGGGGGGSGGTATAGNDATSATGAAAVPGGGPGGNGRTSGGSGSAPVSSPGGGGGGGRDSTNTGGAGATGRVKITVQETRVLIASMAGAAGSDADGNNFAEAITATTVEAFSPTDPTLVETWHAVSLTNSWTNNASRPACSYRLVPSPSRLVEVIGRVDHAAVSGTSIMSTALPTQYRPAHTQGYPCAPFNNTAAPVQTPVINLNTSGVLTFLNLPTGTTSVEFHVFFALDL